MLFILGIFLHEHRFLVCSALKRNINKKGQKASPRVGGWGSRQYSKEKGWDLSPVLLVLWKCFMKGRELYFTQDLFYSKF